MRKCYEIIYVQVPTDRTGSQVIAEATLGTTHNGGGGGGGQLPPVEKQKKHQVGLWIWSI